MTVDTAPGRGCRVSVVFPYRSVNPLIQQKGPHDDPREPANSRSATI
jgi:hypothetical protein